MDQSAPGEDLAKLPLAIACCERLVTYVADGYGDRAWCRVEQTLSARFMFADHQLVIGEGYRNGFPATGQGKSWKLRDPATGSLSHEPDREHIRRLTSAANANVKAVRYGVEPALKVYDLRHD